MFNIHRKLIENEEVSPYLRHVIVFLLAYTNAPSKNDPLSVRRPILFL